MVPIAEVEDRRQRPILSLRAVAPRTIPRRSFPARTPWLPMRVLLFPQRPCGADALVTSGGMLVSANLSAMIVKYVFIILLRRSSSFHRLCQSLHSRKRSQLGVRGRAFRTTIVVDAKWRVATLHVTVLGALSPTLAELNVTAQHQRIHVTNDPMYLENGYTVFLRDGGRAGLSILGYRRNLSRLPLTCNPFPRKTRVQGCSPRLWRPAGRMLCGGSSTSSPKRPVAVFASPQTAFHSDRHKIGLHPALSVSPNK